MSFCASRNQLVDVVNYASDGFNNLILKNIPSNQTKSFKDFVFIQQYSKDNLVLKIKGSSKLSLNEIKNISSLNIEYDNYGNK